MKHLQTYSLFEATQSLTQDQQDFLNRCTSGSWSVNPSTGLVDVQGDFDCFREGLKDFLGIRFGSVSGNFSCSENRLTTLAGAPRIVGGFFSCYHNRITSLAGAPETVGGDFECSRNSLTTLEGAPESVEGKFMSDDLRIPEGEWGLETFIDLLKTGTPKQQQLVAPLVDPKVLQQQIDENPEGMLVKLKGRLKHPHFQGLKWPQHLGKEKDLLSDLDDVGL